jgi:subtilase family serine protease
VTFYDGPPTSGMPIGQAQIPSGLSGCGGATAISTTWTVSSPGLHKFYVEVDSTHSITETDDNNNIAIGWALVSTQRVYLPVLLR